ncbi:hypothetical protein MMA15_27680 [Streptomyces sp. M600PL45_2]|uniref:Uncharacterized protein n=1 Tax=Streptomyces marispadix TaxID=2922868 RepID=A0ABS9T672_9ACTN|nr:hypothetical protein [Streptomyces marispadix]MCH6164045.1 hypothetical protein [Streptomyces marispadix]
MGAGEAHQVAGRGGEGVAGQRYGRVRGGLEAVDDEEGQAVDVGEGGLDGAGVEVVSVVDVQGGLAGFGESCGEVWRGVQQARSQSLVVGAGVCGGDAGDDVRGGGAGGGVEDGAAVDDGGVAGRARGEEAAAGAGVRRR